MSRRRLLSLAPGLALPGALAPGALLASAPSERRFLFVFCRGGWDTTMLWTPAFGVPGVAVEGDATEAEVNGIRFVDSGARPSARAFLEAYGDRTCVINGLEVRSVAHLRCRRLLFAGATGGDDWPSLLAAGGAAYPFPSVVISGPAYTDRYANLVVRVGSEGQLNELIDGAALAAPPASEVEAAVDAWVRARAARWTAAAETERGVDFGALYEASLDDIARLQSGELPDFRARDLGCSRDLSADLSMAFSAMEADLCRCAVVEYNGWCDEGWDTHTNNQSLQSTNYEELFGYLNAAMEDLVGRVAPDGAPLSERLTIVLFSEMGRHPELNTWGGKEHWTLTSCALIGAGVRGGQVIGALDEDMLGSPVDLESGEVSDAGTALLPEHLGATLAQMAGLDPESVAGAPAIGAAIEG